MANLKLTLREAVTYTTIEDSRCFADHKLLCEWLDCYQYIVPSNRKLDSNIIELVMAGRSIAHEIFIAALICDLVESTLTLNEQYRITSWIAHTR